MAAKVFALSPSTNGVSSLPATRQIGCFAPALREFIAGPENQLLTQVRATVTSDWGRFNPLCIHGVAGVGKTQLLHCLRQEARRSYPELRDIFVTGADYARAVAEAIDVDSLDELRARHCAADLFILDGLHQLATKFAAQYELIRLLDFAVRHDLQVVVASLNSLDHLPGLQDKLTSRLAGGLVNVLAPPQQETREAILRKLAASLDITLADHDLQQLANGSTHGVTTVTDLQAAIHRLSCFPNQEKCGDVRRKEVTGKVIVKTVARIFRVSTRDLTGTSRRQSVVKARAACVYLARTLLGLSFQRIGGLLGNRDHTTIMNAFRRSTKFMNEDLCFKRSVQEAIESTTS